MLQKILENYYSFAPWEQECERFKRLRYLDAWLDGKFYDPIPTAFSDEEDSSRRYQKIHERRPSVQHNLPRHIANMCARKLFGGKHAPRIRHKDDGFRLKVQAFIEEIGLNEKMLETVKRGSVGSVLVLFRMRQTPDNQIETMIEVMRSRVITPIFDSFNQLQEVRIHYPIPGRNAMAISEVDAEGRLIKSTNNYWYIRHITPEADFVCMPIIEGKWNPVDGYTNPKMNKFLKLASGAINPLGFLPAVWIKNQTGGEDPDGKCTFEDALNNFIEYDYMDSQTGRGLFYHASPQLVIKGKIMGEDGDPDADDRQQGRITGPAHTIRLQADNKSDFDAETGHDAKLLDSNAQGLTTAIDFSSKLKHVSMEQVSAARKDLESIKGAMSGKAMELIDQDFLDLIDELRTQYCDKGYLCLLKKLLKAAKIMGHPLFTGATEKQIDGLFLQYAPYSTPDPQEFLYIVQALTLATGLGAKNPAGGVDGAPAAPVAPHEGLLTIEEANHYLKMVMDFAMDSEDKPVINETEPTDDLVENPIPGPENPTEPPQGVNNNDPLSEPKAPTHVPVINVPF